MNFTTSRKKKEVFIIKIIAFDQALGKTGVCTIDGDTVYHSLIDLSKTKDVLERSTMMRQMIQSRIKNNRPDLVVIEDVALQSSPKTLIQLAQGAIMGVCELNNIPYEIIKPSEWRKILGFKQGRVKRAELKQQAIDYVKTYYGEDVSSDEADAMCIATAVKMELENNKLNQED